MPRTALLGLPRMGPDRELKRALEAHWAGRAGERELRDAAAAIRADSWARARAAGVDVIPSGDFSLYDHVLDAAWALGAVPARFGGPGATGLGAYFAMARGGPEARPLEMTKWLDTNYHHLVPELEPGWEPRPRAGHWVEQLEQARALGIATRPVIVGPYSFARLAKGAGPPAGALGRLVPAYRELLAAMASAGAAEVQLDEPCLVLDPPPSDLAAAAEALGRLADGAAVAVCVTTYFAALEPDAIARLCALPIGELHLDLVRAPEQLAPALAALRARTARLSLGVLDGRNVWAADLDAALAPVDAAVEALGPERVTVAPSCSLLHVPHEAARDPGIPEEIRGWLAFAAERLEELRVLGLAVAEPARRDELLAPSRERAARRRSSALANDPAVRARAAALAAGDAARRSPAAARRAVQRERLRLPELPTTTIGSFPQTEEIRAARRDRRAGALGPAAYERFLEARIDEAIGAQERLGLDVLVHGEPERSDMVEYFAERLRGFALSANGWVQSYGSRCVKPPILYGDVSRAGPMTVRWWAYAQGLTERPVKGMLTGPVTMLQWSFVRDDQPRRETCVQLALAVRDEIVDLEAAGAAVIQVDEAALREGVPLRAAEQDDYLRWAVDCFRLATAPAADATQVHTHMCYSDLSGVMEHVARMDADVLSIEASRSGMEELDAVGAADYGGDVGPGVYDIHSPRVPPADEIERLIELAERRLGRERLWVNPDCGLKTRRWPEVLAALGNMVEAARRRRAVRAVP